MSEENWPRSGLSPLSDGLWLIADAAADLARQEDMEIGGYQDLARRMAECAKLPLEHANRLRARNIQSKLQVEAAAAGKLAVGVYPRDVNAWLAAVGAPYRWVAGDRERQLCSVAAVAQEAAARKFPASDHGSDDERILAAAWQRWAAATFQRQANGYAYDRKISVFVAESPSVAVQDPFSFPQDRWRVDDSGRSDLLQMFEEDPAEIRPAFDMPPRPLAVPRELRLLPSDLTVSVRWSWRQLSEYAGPAASVMEQYEDAIARQAGGWLVIDEASALLQEGGAGLAKTWMEKLKAAAMAAEGDKRYLPLHEAGSLGRIDFTLTRNTSSPRKVSRSQDWVHVDDLNRWLEHNESRLPFRFTRQALEDPSVSCPPTDNLDVPRMVDGALLFPVGTRHLKFGELADLIAYATWPSDGFAAAAASTGLQKELVRAVDDGELRVLSPLTLGPHEFPVGDALRTALVTVQALRAWLKSTDRMDVAVSGEPMPSTVDAPIKPVQRQQAQEAAILSKLIELGFTPTELPAPPAGKESSAKTAVKQALGYSPDVMKKAWQRLRNDGRIKDL